MVYDALVTGEAKCKGQIDKLGNLDRQDCTPGRMSPRIFTGSIVNVILEYPSAERSGEAGISNREMEDLFRSMKKKRP